MVILEIITVEVVVVVVVAIIISFLGATRTSMVVATDILKTKDLMVQTIKTINITVVVVLTNQTSVAMLAVSNHMVVISRVNMEVMINLGIVALTTVIDLISMATGLM